MTFATSQLGGILAFSPEGDGSDDQLLLFHQDYSSPAPPPPPPHPPSVSCTDDLKGIGSLDTTCQILSDLNLTDDVYIQGKGNFYIHPGVSFSCSFQGCSIAINVSSNFTLSANATVRAGAFELTAYNGSFLEGSIVNTIVGMSRRKKKIF